MPNPRKSLTGRTFGHLHVRSYIGKAPNGVSLWLCFCDACQSEKVMYYNVLVHQKTKSCGCTRGRPPKNKQQ